MRGPRTGRRDRLEGMTDGTSASACDKSHRKQRDREPKACPKNRVSTNQPTNLSKPQKAKPPGVGGRRGAEFVVLRERPMVVSPVPVAAASAVVVVGARVCNAVETG